jgi:hypothetical protein
MAADRIAEANKLLAHPPVVGLALSRALGLHVVGSLAQRHGIAVELRPGAPGGVVALVALPTAVLEPRPVHAPPASATGNPVYSPDLDDRGEAEPLGARRLVSRPPDEPPVEEWRWEGLSDGGAAPSAPVEGVSTYDAPTYDPPAYDAPTYDVPPAPVDAPTYEPPVPVDTPSYDAPTYDAPTYDTPSYDAPAYEAPAPDAAPPPQPDPDEDAFQEAGPLPTRVPGQHLSHHPRIAAEAPDNEVDPMRAYRVHELLTRHAQGKQRGQASEDTTADTSPVPGAPGVQEDGR